MGCPSPPHSQSTVLLRKGWVGARLIPQETHQFAWHMWWGQAGVLSVTSASSNRKGEKWPNVFSPTQPPASSSIPSTSLRSSQGQSAQVNLGTRKGWGVGTWPQPHLGGRGWCLGWDRSIPPCDPPTGQWSFSRFEEQGCRDGTPGPSHNLGHRLGLHLSKETREDPSLHVWTPPPLTLPHLFLFLSLPSHTLPLPLFPCSSRLRLSFSSTPSLNSQD